MQMSTEKVVIIIPTYNEALGIEETIAQVFQISHLIPNKAVHVLVFDSASTDDTPAIVTRMQATYAQLHLQTEAKKSGLGSAYLQAMRYALTELSADIVVEFDADLSHQPKYLVPMLEKIATYDVVLGSRYVRGGQIPADWGWHRKLLSVLGNYVARCLLTPKYKDFTSGFRATRREALLKALPEQFLSNHYAYKLELLWSLHKNKARICEYPIVFVDREKGQSKLPANTIVESLQVLFSLRFHKCFDYFKMCLVGLSGTLVQYVTYNLLRQKIDPVSAVQIAVLVAMINNFALNNRFTFKKNPLVFNHRMLKSFLLFVLYSLFMIGFQSYWLHLGLMYWGSGFVKENSILISGMVLGSIFNYLIYTNFVWRKNKPLGSQ